MLKSSLCDYSDAYILARGTIIVVGAGVETAARAADRNNKQVLFKNCTPFTDCISEINNSQVDNTKDLGVVMPMYNLIEYSNNYSKASGSVATSKNLFFSVYVIGTTCFDKMFLFHVTTGRQCFL